MFARSPSMFDVKKIKYKAIKSKNRRLSRMRHASKTLRPKHPTPLQIKSPQTSVKSFKWCDSGLSDCPKRKPDCESSLTKTDTDYSRSTHIILDVTQSAGNLQQMNECNRNWDTHEETEYDIWFIGWYERDECYQS